MISTLCLLISHQVWAYLMRKRTTRILLRVFIRKMRVRFFRIVVLWGRVRRRGEFPGSGLRIPIRNLVSVVGCWRRAHLGIWIIQGGIRMSFLMASRSCCRIFQLVIMIPISVLARMSLRLGWYRRQFIILGNWERIFTILKRKRSTIQMIS